MIEHNELLREIDEDLRRERLQKWWKDFGSTVVAASFAVVALAVGVVLWQNHQRERDTAFTARLLDAARMEEQGKFAEAATGYKAVANEAKGDLGALATLREADALQRAGKTAEAVALYQEIYEKTRADATLRDLAGLRYANSLPADTSGMEKMNKIYSDLSGANRPYRWTAMELKALLDWQQGRLPEARAGLQQLAQAPLPDSMKSRVQSALASLPESPHAQ